MLIDQLRPFGCGIFVLSKIDLHVIVFYFVEPMVSPLRMPEVSWQAWVVGAVIDKAHSNLRLSCSNCLTLQIVTLFLFGV